MKLEMQIAYFSHEHISGCGRLCIDWQSLSCLVVNMLDCRALYVHGTACVPVCCPCCRFAEPVPLSLCLC